MRLQERLNMSIRELVDEVKFRFPVEECRAQKLLTEALKNKEIINLVVVIVNQTLMEDSQND